MKVIGVAIVIVLGFLIFSPDFTDLRKAEIQTRQIEAQAKTAIAEAQKATAEAEAMAAWAEIWDSITDQIPVLALMTSNWGLMGIILLLLLGVGGGGRRNG